MESKKVGPPVVVPAEIQELSRQIEEWRRTRPHRAPMPDPLWTLAANLAAQYGVAQVSRFLHLDYYALKEHLQHAEHHTIPAPVPRPAGPTFIELPSVTASAVSEYSIELEHPRGQRMRIHAKGAAVPDLVALTRTFWGMKR
jgi:hypothetical protein